MELALISIVMRGNGLFISSTEFAPNPSLQADRMPAAELTR